ncbi:GNAT family N-acetyltransferase [Fulvimarina sp. 2208YS6-2-32]|uniref:GNAT family N-acetyltransferase n=2 Tax=Fulvimarina uroteuthidis TaxID=3098149 RepID=A0ABU5I4U4_9HYPH|nr:GNAT family N-acetyltransferase [Fulvimarina sp. 2208YS6-2-32]
MPDDEAGEPIEHDATSLAFRWSAFDEMSGREVHDLLRLRNLVFVVEQACAFAEIDGHDPDAIHLRQFVGETLTGCLRMAEDGTAVRIGRIVTASHARGKGHGHDLMAEALRYAARRFADRDLVLSAQAHLGGFYERHGFVAVSDPYDEDGISHIAMHRAATHGAR